MSREKSHRSGQWSHPCTAVDDRVSSAACMKHQHRRTLSTTWPERRQTYVHTPETEWGLMQGLLTEQPTELHELRAENTKTLQLWAVCVEMQPIIVIDGSENCKAKHNTTVLTRTHTHTEATGKPSPRRPTERSPLFWGKRGRFLNLQ